MAVTDAQLSELLLENQLIGEEDLELVKEYAAQNEIGLSEALIDKDLMTDENLGRLLADFLHLPFIRLSKVAVPEELTLLLPEVLARKKKTIAFAVENRSLHIATAEPGNEEFFKGLGRKAGLKPELFFATERDISEALRVYKKDIQKTFDALLEKSGGEGDLAGGGAPIEKIVHNLLEYGYFQKASDVHIEPGEEHTTVRFRIDGVLHDVLRLPAYLHEKIVSRIKVLSRLRTDEHLAAQDGKLQVDLEDEEVNIRVSVVPQVEGEKVVLRLLTSHFRQFGLQDLGMNERDLQKVNGGFNKPYGMVLSTGPTGSGKSTTMYAILKILNNRDKNIATIEDPVEYELEGLNQIQVNPKTNLTFAEGLRSILRQDPDIIYVGEIRDEETASIAVNSATTGHLVLSTLHTNNAATTLPRLINMNVEPFLVASTVNVIIGQRLVRKICEQCRVSEITKVNRLASTLNIKAAQKFFGKKKELTIYHGKGCQICHYTGYNGRVGIFEVLEITEEIRELIMAKADAEEVRQLAIKQGMVTMQEDGLEKIIQGMTTLEEVLRATVE